MNITDAAVVAEVYRTFAPIVHARARRMIGGEAEDIVQEVFMRLLNHPPKREALAAWVRTTCTNLCLDRIRSRQRRGQDWTEAVRGELEGADSEDIDVILQKKELCRKILAGADGRTREVALLVHLDEMTQEEAAQALGLSRKTVSERLKKFREDALKQVKRWTR